MFICAEILFVMFVHTIKSVILHLPHTGQQPPGGIIGRQLAGFTGTHLTFEQSAVLETLPIIRNNDLVIGLLYTEQLYTCIRRRYAINH